MLYTGFMKRILVLILICLLFVACEYEYKNMRVAEGSAGRVIANMGNDGWQLVSQTLVKANKNSVLRSTLLSGSGDRYDLVFKRRKPLLSSNK